MSSNPVFVKAIPRSGGTLLATLLDAHQDIAMSYEIYEDYLRDESLKPLSPEGVVEWIISEQKNVENDTQWINKLPDRNLRVFLFRARRGGLGVVEILETLKGFARRRHSFYTSEDRLDFVEALMRKKAQKLGKKVWGGKTQARLYELHERHPDACYFIMRRDVRDMVASMLNKGNFTYTAKQAAELWKERVLELRRFVARCNPKAMEVCYERLTREPETVLPEICDVIGVAYDRTMRDFYKQDLSLFRNPHGHLSSEQLRCGLNANSIGRWKKDLSDEDVATIEGVAGELMDE